MPHQGQRVVLSYPARFKWVAAGRRWRKTCMWMALATESALRNQVILWASPTYDQCRIGWDEMRKAAGGYADFNQSRMEVQFPRAGKVIFRSLDDPDNARGHTADGVIIDEAPLVQEYAWYEILRPVLSDTGGWAGFGGTPKGRNWFWRESVAALDRDDSAAWAIPTLGVTIQGGQLLRKAHPLENPDFPFLEAQQMFATLPERIFRQEFMSEFLEDAGAVFRKVTEAATAIGADVGQGTVMGVDWAKTSDFSVVTVLDSHGNMLAMDRFNQIDYTVQVGRLKALCQRYKPTKIIAESNAMGEPLIEQLRREDLPVIGFNTTAASKTQAIEALSLAFERGEVKILPDRTLVNELQAFEMTRLPSGATRYSAPQGLHDDCVISLALAWHGMTKVLTGELFL